MRTALQDRVGGLPPAFWWLWLGTLVNRAGTFIQPFLILYLTGPRHLSVPVAGSVVTVWGLGALVSQPVGGYLTDRIGRRRTLAGGMFAVALALGTLASARGVAAITGAALLVGLVGDVYRPAVSATVADLLDGEQRVRAFALQFWAVNLGFSVATVSAGFLARVGFGPLFAVDAVTSAAFGLVVLRRVPETRPLSTAPLEDAGPRAWRIMLADRLLLATVLLVLGYASLYTQVYVALPLAVRDAGLGTGTYGLVMAVNGVVIVLVQPLALPFLARTPSTVLLPGSMLMVGAGIALSGVCHTGWLFTLTVVIWSLGEIGQSGSFQALVARLAPEAMRGRYVGAVGLAWGGSAVVGPFVGTRVYAAAPPVLWLGCAALGVVTAAGQLALTRRLA